MLLTSIENMREISDAVNKDIADNMLLLKQTLVNFDSISSSVNKFWAHERQNAELVMNNVAASTQKPASCCGPFGQRSCCYPKPLLAKN